MKRTKRDEDELDSDIDVSSSSDEELHEASGSEDVVNVDFDFFNLNPDVDFHATKNFLKQLFQGDANSLQLSSLADHLLSQAQVGTTIKTDGMQSDPFSILAVTDLNDSSSAIKQLRKYILDKSSSNAALHSSLELVMAPGSKNKVGLVLSERLINMPLQTVPPMYRLLAEDMARAGVEYDYIVLPSRMYQVFASQVDKELEEEQGPSKKKSRGRKGTNYDYYHEEDDLIKRLAKQHGYFDYSVKNMDPDARRVFNDYAIDPKLSISLLDGATFADLVKQMAVEYS